MSDFAVPRGAGPAPMLIAATAGSPIEEQP
jgi:hypothetical protein